MTISAQPPGSFPGPAYFPLFSGGVMCLLGLIFFTIGRVRTTMCKDWVPRWSAQAWEASGWSSRLSAGI
ncbi:MAG TPA: hypothetical protein VF391_11745 [Dermatophilaceae bacterium]